MAGPDLLTLVAEFQTALGRATSVAELDEVRRLHTGKKSPLKALLKGMKDLPADDRPGFAKAVNDAQAELEAALDTRQAELEAEEIDARIDREWLDLTLPGVANRRGARHPLTDVENRCLEMLRRLGFQVEDGPEVERPYYNFDALNIPEHHPARDLQDTFYVPNGGVLRTHTTPVQARILEKHPPLPIKVASLGRVYRNEAVDANHLAAFHQFEGFWVDKVLTVAHLKGVLTFICRSIYGADCRIRFKPKYYPYTEPSVGVDLLSEIRREDGTVDARWVTILGSGMIHPNVFEEFGYDPNEVSGIAFGLGTSRMAPERYKVPYVKALYEADLQLHHQLHRGPAGGVR